MVISTTGSKYGRRARVFLASFVPRQSNNGTKREFSSARPLAGAYPVAQLIFNRQHTRRFRYISTPKPASKRLVRGPDSNED
jgi:hypothetical protein